MCLIEREQLLYPGNSRVKDCLGDIYKYTRPCPLLHVLRVIALTS